MSAKRYALIPLNSTEVENIIVADSDFSQNGYFLVEIKTDIFCQPGMFYNVSDYLFYDDEAFTVINAASENDDSN